LAEHVYNEHYSKRPDEVLIDTCSAGFSRSAAFALQAMICAEKLQNAKLPDPQKLALNLLETRGEHHRDWITPNRLLLRYIDEHYGYNGALYEGITENPQFRKNYQDLESGRNVIDDPFWRLKQQNMEIYSVLHEAWTRATDGLNYIMPPTRHCEDLIKGYRIEVAPGG
jgi:hypothetical protein